MAREGLVRSVNIGRARGVTLNGRRVLTAIHKEPADSRVAVLPMGLEGDEQADLSIHGGLSKAVYLYPSEHHAFWRTVRAQAKAGLWDETPAPGAFGENLTTEGVTEADLYVGDVLVFPHCRLAVSEPRFPCGKLNAAMGFPQAARMMADSAWCGAYLSVREPGTIAAGDRFTLQPGARDVNIAELFRARVGRVPGG